MSNIIFKPEEPIERVIDVTFISSTKAGMNEQKNKAEIALNNAVTLMLENDPVKVARMVHLRLQTPDGLESAQAVIFAENESVASMLEARFSEPTQAERINGSIEIDMIEALATRVRAGQPIHVTGSLNDISGKMHIAMVNRLREMTGMPVQVIHN